MNNIIVAVTGGNRGIGKEICRQLAVLKKEYTILLTARLLANAETTVAQLGFNNIKPYQLDVNSKESIDTFVKNIEKDFGGIDVLINNAAYAFNGPALDEKIANDTISPNFLGLMNLSFALLPILKTRPDGRIINMSSSLGKLTDAYSPALKEKFLSPTLTIPELLPLVQQFTEAVKLGTIQQQGYPTSAYRVSKVAVNMLTRIMARDEKNVTINCCCPGWVRTDMGGPNATRDVNKGAETPVWLATAPLSEINKNGSFFKDKQLLNWI